MHNHQTVNRLSLADSPIVRIFRPDTDMADMLEPALPRDSELADVLAAWHAATERLQQTHESLRDEVHRLTAELEVKNRQLEHQQRLADLGQMASHVAHEVRNSLVPMTLYLSLLRRRIGADPGNQDILDKIDTGMIAVESTVKDLLHFTSDRQPQCQAILLRSLIDEIVQSMAPQLSAQHIITDLDISSEMQILADRHMLHRAILNLVLNALDAMPDGGELTITGLSSGDHVILEVADSGPGLTAEAARRAFEPFFTTKGGGTGLGLAIVSRIAEVHGGKVVAMNCAEGGAAFSLRIPQRFARKAAA